MPDIGTDLLCTVPGCDEPCAIGTDELELGMPQSCERHFYERSLTPRQRSVCDVVCAHGGTSSKVVAAELQISRNTALKALMALVRAGVLDSRLVGGGENEWTTR